jgi:hypothetical protein
MMRRLKRIAGVGLGVATIMIGYLLVVYLHAQQACTCEQVCSTQGCWEGNCPSPCVLKFVQRFFACCTLYHSGVPLACCEATVEKYACVPPPAPVPGGPIHTPTPTVLSVSVSSSSPLASRTADCTGHVLFKRGTIVGDWVLYVCRDERCRYRYE